MTYWKSYLTELADGPIDPQSVGSDSSDGVATVDFFELPQGGAGGRNLTVKTGRFRMRVLA